MSRSSSCPLTPYPRGWYVALPSDRLRVGGVESLRLFGRDVVAFRDERGRAHLVDAYCPHLGAHLGHGGRVVGESIRCPFHGWEFEGGSGKCTRIANGDAPPARAKLESWHVDERAGAIFFWFHERGEAPAWRIGDLPELDEPGWSDWRVSSWDLPARIQDISENDADVSHSPVMHGFTDAVPDIAMATDGPRCEWTLRATLKLEAFGAPKLPRIGLLRHVPTTAPSTVSVVRWGISLGWVRQTLELPGGLRFRTQSFGSTTPIDEEHVRVTFRHRVRRAPTELLTQWMLRRYATLFDATLEEDIAIWRHKIYRVRPVVTRSDWAILRFRKWARQFYDPAHYDAAMGREAAGESGSASSDSADAAAE
jgi:phenylpropionate dioxygenase-like ring-hydroxylating dioxygenase large terminal subunit